MARQDRGTVHGARRSGGILPRRRGHDEGCPPSARTCATRSSNGAPVSSGPVRQGRTVRLHAENVRRHRVYDDMEERTSTLRTSEGTRTRRGTRHVLLTLSDYDHERVHHRRYDISYTRGRTKITSQLHGDHAYAARIRHGHHTQ
eukprot:7638013-Pyramimonas_sp.AAC.1